MKPTDPAPGTPPPQEPSGYQPPAQRPGTGGGATYRHPAGSQLSSYHDGVADHALEDELHNPETAHEHIDVNIRGVITSVVILTVVTIAAHLIIVGMFRWLEGEAASNQPPVSPLARPSTAMPRHTREAPELNPTGNVPGPQLLTNEPAALEKQRAEEQKRLHGYGWVNEAAGVAHIPIEEAKKRTLERGLPIRADAVAPPALGTRLPAAGESSGGRVITAPPPEPGAQQPAPPPAAKPHGH